MPETTEETKLEITGRNPVCKLCTLNKTSQADDTSLVCLWGTGPETADIVLVGEAPGFDEIKGNEPFIGDSGKLLNEYLGKASINRGDIYITNTTKCRPPMNRAPKNNEIKACAPYLDYELKQIKPKVIGVLGSIALKRVLNVDGITKLRGKPTWSHNYNCWVVPMYHPSYILRNGKSVEMTEALLKDLKLVKRIAETGETGQISTKITVVDTLEKWGELKTHLANAQITSFDLETMGTFLNGDILSAQFCWEVGNAWVLPFFKTFKDTPCSTCDCEGKIKLTKEEKKELNTKKRTKECPTCNGRKGLANDPQPLWSKEHYKTIWAGLKPWIESANYKKVGQNIKYDYKFMRQFDVRLQGVIFDTMLAHYLLDENNPKAHALDEMGLKFTDMGNYALEIYNALGVESKDIDENTYARAPFDVLCKYGGKDADCTFRLMCIFFPKIKEQKLMPLLTKIMIPLSFELAEMERTGIEIDVQYYERLKVEYEEKLKIVEDKLYDFPAVKALEQRQVKPVNFNSHDQIRVLFFDILKLPVIKKTKKNKKSKNKTAPKPSTDAEVLEQLADMHDIPKFMQEQRKLAKFLSTYVVMPKYAGEDGRVHTSYTQHITVTGRLSSGHPNLQNIPKHDPEMAKQIRNGIRATKGYIFGEWDYGQLEFRLLGYVCGDPQMLKDLSDPKMDIHKRIASVAFEVPYEQVTKELREQAKTIVYALVYGKTKDNLAKETGLSVDQVEAVIEAIFGRYPRLKPWIEQTQNRAKAGYDIIAWSGRRRHLQNAYSKANSMPNRRAKEMMIAEASRQAVNSPIQGGGSDILCVATVRVCRKLRKLGLKTRPVLTIHDSLILEIWEPELEQVKQLMKEEMLRQIGKITVPMVIDSSFGYRLGDMEKEVIPENN